MAGHSPLRTAIVGYGIAGARFHGPILEALSAFDVAAVVTANPARGAAARAAHPNALIVEDVQTLWSSAERYDVVVVASPNSHHVRHGVAALRHGLNVVVDKPLAPTLAGIQSLIEASESTGKLLTVFQNRRWDSDYLSVVDVVRSGRLGDVYRFESAIERWWPIGGGGWRETPGEDVGGGILLDLGPHLLDQAIHLFGSVSSIVAQIALVRKDTSTDDDVWLSMVHDNGVETRIAMSKAVAGRNARYRVLGSLGTYVKFGTDPQEDQALTGGSPRDLDWGVEDGSIAATLSNDATNVRLPSRTGDYSEFYRRLARAILYGDDVPVKPVDAFEVMRLLTIARDSSVQGKRLSTS